jgi:hypothetical protein
MIPLTRQPVVSTANIAQLAVDLLIASLSLRVIGVFDSRDLVPVVGGREDEGEGISTPLECEFRLQILILQSPIPSSATQRSLFTVFGSEGYDIVVIQQRSPVLVVHLFSPIEPTLYSTPLTRIPPESRRESKSLSMHCSNFSRNREGSLQFFFCPASTCPIGQMHR